MAALTGKQISNSYKQLLQVGSNNSGLSRTIQTVQDGSGTNSALQLSTFAVNINGNFQLNGVTLTANASTLNAVADLTGATGIVAVSAGNVYGRTITGGTGVSITNGDGTEGNPTIALNTTGVVSGTYGPLTNLEINAVGQVVSATAVSTSVSVPTIRASEFIGGTFKGTTADFSSDTSIGGTVVIEGAATFNSTVSVSGALTGSSATFTGTVSAGDISGANATFSGNISATEYYGDGSNLTGIVAASATFATSAGFAASATNASFALSATNANFAASASFASSASYAASAGEASFAVSASSAAFATSADSATFAVSATNATTAYNVSGGIADISGLTAVSASISDLRATQFYGTSVSIDYLNASDITAITISATDLKSSTLSFTSVSVSSLRVYRLAVETTLSATYGTFTGNVSAVSFYGDGSNLTDLPTAPVSVSAYTVNQLTIVSAATLAGTDLETRINTVSVNTSVNAAAITSINAIIEGNVSADSGTFNTLTVITSASVGGTLNVGGNVGIGTTTVDTALGTKLHVAGTIRTDTGSANANPAIVFDHDNFADADANYIMLDRTDEAMRFNVNASERMRIDSSGNVGIGTTSPATTLDIVDSVTNPIQIKFGSSASAASGRLGVGSTGNAIAVFDDNTVLESRTGGLALGSDNNNPILFYNTASRIERMRITSSGNVGIGTTSPDFQLDVSGTTDPRIILQSTGTASTDDTIFMNRVGGTTATNQIWFGDSGNAETGKLQYDHSNNAMTFHTNGGTERMRIDSAGNVGIGTSSPDSGTPLHVQESSASLGANPTASALLVERAGSVAMTLGTSNTGSATVFFGDPENLTGGRVQYDNSDNALEFWANALERMRISSTGYVGIGISAPAVPLHISSATPSIRLTDTDDNSDASIAAAAGGLLVLDADINNEVAGTAILFRVDGGSEKMRINSVGSVGIGNTAPSYLLDLYRSASTVARIRNSAATGGTPSTTHGEFVIESTDANMGMEFLGSTTADQRILFSDTASPSGQIVYNHTSNFMSFTANGSERVRIDSSGNVGIGTASPATKLDVNGTLTSDSIINSGTIVNSGTASTASTPTYTWGGQQALTGMYLPLSNTIAFSTNATERLRINSSGNVGIGTSTPNSQIGFPIGNNTKISQVAATGHLAGNVGSLGLTISDGGGHSGVFVNNTHNGTYSSQDITFLTAEGGVSSATERMRITSSGNVGINNTEPAGLFEVGNAQVAGSDGEDGFSFETNGQIRHSTNQTIAMYMTDTSPTTGTHNYIVFRYQGTTIGDIDTTDNTTIRYNTFTGAHWSQFTDHSQPEIPLGTVMSTINEMCNHTQFEYVDENGETQKTDIAGSFEIGSTHTIYIDEDGAQAEGTAIAQSTHKRLAKVKVSDTAGDKSVYGVFAGHYKDGDSSIESLGLGAIRVGSGVTVANGDLLESAGDGTARPQTGDNADLFKASTIAKVTSTTVIETYDDGSYTVPCTLHCG